MNNPRHYLFAQVALDQPRVDYGQGCGNILAGVGTFALKCGLVLAQGEVTRERIFMENTGQTASANVQTINGEVRYQGEASIECVPGTAAPVIVEFDDIVGSGCGALLPTGKVLDVFDGIEVTCIDNGMPVALIRGADLGCTGYESREQLDADEALKARIDSIRLQAGPLMNLGDVTERSVSKMCLISQPAAGGTINSRSFIPHKCHASIGVFGAVSVASACLISGSVAQGLACVKPGKLLHVSVEHRHRRVYCGAVNR